MLSMVLLVLLLCFEPAKASLFEPAKATLFLGLCMQPAKARPPLPWWRCRVWKNKYWLCSPDGYVRELDEDEEDEIEEIFDRNDAAAKYVWGESAENLAGNCWRGSWEIGGISTNHPTMLAPQITTSTGKAGIPGSLCKASYGHSSSSQPAQGYQWPSNSLARAKSRAQSRTEGPTPGHL